jgi:hypothetical protein
LLDFSRPSQQLETERVNPQHVIEDTLSMLEYRVPLRNIVIKSELPEEELYIQPRLSDFGHKKTHLLG